MGGVIKASTLGALFVAAGMAMVGCGGSTGASAQPTSSNTPATSSSVATASQDKAALLAKAPGQQAVVVPVPTGADAITYDQQGHLTFWSESGNGSWSRDTDGSYPDLGTPSGQPDKVNATGALLTGMQHATFILTGAFSEDGTGNAVGYANGSTSSANWGVVVAQPSGALAPSATPKVDSLNNGVSYGLTFTNGELRTEDCAPDQPLAMCGSQPVVKLWKWDGHQFNVAK